MVRARSTTSFPEILKAPVILTGRLWQILNLTTKAGQETTVSYLVEPVNTGGFKISRDAWSHGLGTAMEAWYPSWVEVQIFLINIGFLCDQVEN